MPPHADFVAAFRSGLEGGALPPGLAAPAEEAARRFAVYRNNVATGLGRALAQRFPVVERLVGVDFFAAMARVFTALHPPRNPVLLDWGAAFPPFLEGFGPVRRLAYLPDIARLELARGRAYHAADAGLVPDHVLADASATWGDELRLRLHPSVGLVPSPHPIVTIWRMNQPGAEPHPLRDPSRETALVARAGERVLTDGLGPGDAAFIAALLARASLAAATGFGRGADPAFDPAPILRRVIALGLVTGLDAAGPKKRRKPMTADAVPAAQRPTALLRRLNGILARTPLDAALLGARLFPAAVFWQSGRTKVEGFSMKDSTFYLFEHVYALPLIPPTLAAWLATIAEHLLPVLLVFGLLTRLSALGLLVMTLVIQVFVFPEAWVTHGLWATTLLLIVARGPGRLSIDRAVGIER
jgi:uncharacterized membrane protein YphA (DoxX/SURF4 family)